MTAVLIRCHLLTQRPLVNTLKEKNLLSLCDLFSCEGDTTQHRRRVVLFEKQQESFVPGRKCSFISVVNFQANCVTLMLHGLYAGPLHRWSYSLLDPEYRTFLYCFYKCLYTCGVDRACFLLAWSWGELRELISGAEPGIMQNPCLVVKRKWGYASPDFFHATLSLIKASQFTGDGGTLR